MATTRPRGGNVCQAKYLTPQGQKFCERPIAHDDEHGPRNCTCDLDRFGQHAERCIPLPTRNA